MYCSSAGQPAVVFCCWRSVPYFFFSPPISRRWLGRSSPNKESSVSEDFV